MLPQDKRAVSEVIGYVIIISLAIIISVAVFVWFKSYVPTDSLKCPDGVSLFVESTNLDESGILNITIKNNGLFSVGGYFIKAKVSPNDKIPMLDLSSYIDSGGVLLGNSVKLPGVGNSFPPGSRVSNTFNLTSLSTNFSSVEVIPFVYQTINGEEKIAFCGTIPSAERVCTPKTCAEQGHECGLSNDGCGNSLFCDDCLTNEYCNNHFKCVITMIYVSPEGNDNSEGTINSPLRTIEGARNYIRQLKLKELFRNDDIDQINVYLRAGTYYITQPILFSEKDSGTKQHPVTYQSYEGETAIIDGGKNIVGGSSWEFHSEGIYRLPLWEFDPQLTDFNVIFVDNKIATRARAPNQNENRYLISDYVEGSRDKFIISGDEIKPEWANSDVEVVILQDWTAPRLKISEVQDIGNGDKIVSFSSNAYRAFGILPDQTRYYVENALGLLDEPGEWYFDKAEGYLYYYPQSGQNINSLNIVIPKTNQFIKTVTGAKIQNLNFKYLKFQHAGFDIGSGFSGGLNTFSAIQLGDESSAFSDSEFSGNIIQYVGSNAIGVIGNNIRIENNDIHEFGGTGILAGKFNFNYNLSILNNLISNNKVYDFGKVYYSAPGIVVTFGVKSSITHNLVYNGPYHGIALTPSPWDFESTGNANYTATEYYNEISYNEVHHVMQELNDGGGIYMYQGNDNMPVLFPTNVNCPSVDAECKPETNLVQFNKVHDIATTGNQLVKFIESGIYLDERVFDTLVQDNIVYNCATGSFYFHISNNNIAKNNIFVDGGLYQLHYRGNYKDSFFNNIVYFTNAGSNLFREPLFLEGIFTTISKNIYYNPYSNPDNDPGAYWLNQLEQWKTYGFDSNSTVADPEFVNYANNNFWLESSSPALDMGFHNIDLTNVGPQ